ncbi:MAG TPA: AMP-binding protein [Bryobacteraceae bacterium]|nr:AMP-binding protein [Bryobacteraceae bacterium]
MARFLVRLLFKLLYRVRVQGVMEPRGRLLIVANHQSFLDPILLGAFLPVRPVWVVHTTIARLWYVKAALHFVPHLTLDTTKAIALKAIIWLVESGRPVLIFPEGRITITGSLMKVYDGPAMVAVRTGADVVPVRIEGLVFSVFSRMSGDFPRRFFPRVSLSIMPPCQIGPADAPTRKEQRRMQGERLRRIMQRAVVETRPPRALWPALLDAARLHGRRRKVMEDVREQPESYGHLIKASLALGRMVSKLSPEGERVGVLMPNLTTTVALLFGMWSVRRVPAILNFTAGAEAMEAGCRQAGVRIVLTSRAFLQKARLTETAARIGGVRLLYLEDLRPTFGLKDKLWLLLWALPFPRAATCPARPHDPAVVLFTSGSEGVPKAVVLSQHGVLTNINQFDAVIEFTSKDRFLSALPIFHAFGLTVGAVAPLMVGARVFLYPTPLHYRMIPEAVYDRESTVLFATGTFLAHYGKHAHPYDFRSLRIVLAGAEKLGDEVRQLWADKFGIRILEGYGATECSPCISVNTPLAYRAGTVGELFPGLDYRLSPVAGIDNGGMLHLRGPNVMLGYLRPNGEIEPVRSDFGPGWYATGDIVEVEPESRFITIVGRVRRFAKVAGEMVSLETVERIAAAASPTFQHASAAVPQPGRGEMILLFSEDPALERARLAEAARTIGVPELAVPRRVVHVAHLPLLGNGKKDYVTLNRMAAEAAAPSPVRTA